MQELRNIIILNDFNYVNGGVAQVAITSANAFADRGFRVIFFSAVEDPARTTLSGKIEKYSTGQPDILHNPSRLNALSTGLWNKKAARLLAAVLEKLDPADSIIHLHGWVKALSPSIGKVITESGFSVVCSLHDFFTACPNGGFYNYPRKEVCRLKAMSLACICTNCDSRNYGHKAWRVIRQAIQSGIGHIPGGIRHFISISAFSEKILQPYLPASAQVYLLSNPVNYSIPSRPRADISQKTLLFVGRLSPEKGAALACEAARMAGARLTVVGEGVMKTELEEKYPEIEFKGWLSPPEIFQLMLQSSALVFSSIWYETQGLVVVEALSVGLPVIVSDVSAASEYVDGLNGCIFSAGNVVDLAEKMKKMLQNTTVTDEMSRHAHGKYWEQPLLFEKYITDSLALYSQILEKDKTIPKK